MVLRTVRLLLETFFLARIRWAGLTKKVHFQSLRLGVTKDVSNAFIALFLIRSFRLYNGWRYVVGSLKVTRVIYDRLLDTEPSDHDAVLVSDSTQISAPISGSDVALRAGWPSIYADDRSGMRRSCDWFWPLGECRAWELVYLHSFPKCYVRRPRLSNSRK